METFFMGTHRAHWLELTDVPLFPSRRILEDRKTLPVARGPWALDSGGFTELNLHGRWTIGAPEYAALVLRLAREVGRLEWAAPMDWMSEPSVRAKTGLTTAEHQRRTLANFLELRELLGPLVIPVLQGWDGPDEYLRHVEAYLAAGVDLEAEPIVGVGSICRRRQDERITAVLRALQPLRLHAFGVRSRALRHNAAWLASADSLAWSSRARYKGEPMPGCTHRNCANCIHFALDWHRRQVDRLGLWGLSCHHASAA